MQSVGGMAEHHAKYPKEDTASRADWTSVFIDTGEEELRDADDVMDSDAEAEVGGVGDSII